jgi:anti-sigma-K factor RskA
MQLLRPDPHTLAGAYVLDAIDDPAEHSRFARHLRRCQSCAAEVRGLREVATALAMAATRPVPAAMHGRVLTAVRQTRQVPPDVRQRAQRQSRPSGWWPRLVAVAAVVAIVLAVFLGIRLAVAGRQLSAASAQQRAIAAVLGAPGARILTGRTTAGGEAIVVTSAARREMVIITTGLRVLPDGEVYQMWLMGPPATRSAGLLPAAVGGRTAPVLASGLSRGDEFGITIEPAGGTRQPTTTPIVVLKLTVRGAAATG